MCWHCNDGLPVKFHHSVTSDCDEECDASVEEYEQIVAWMRNYLQEQPNATKIRAISAWLAAHDYDSFAQSGYALTELVVAINAAKQSTE